MPSRMQIMGILWSVAAVALVARVEPARRLVFNQ